MCEGVGAVNAQLVNFETLIQISRKTHEAIQAILSSARNSVVMMLRAGARIVASRATRKIGGRRTLSTTASWPAREIDVSEVMR